MATEKEPLPEGIEHKEEPEKDSNDKSNDLQAKEILPSSRVRPREIRENNISFEEAYQRETIYIDRTLKPKFEHLAKELRRSKTSLINEALIDMLKKYHGL